MTCGGSELLMALRRPRMGMKMAAPPTVVPAQAGTQGWGDLDSRFRGSDGWSCCQLIFMAMTCAGGSA